MKHCSISLVIREMQTSGSMKHKITDIRMLFINKTRKYHGVVEKRGPQCTSLGIKPRTTTYVNSVSVNLRRK